MIANLEDAPNIEMYHVAEAISHLAFDRKLFGLRERENGSEADVGAKVNEVQKKPANAKGVLLER